MPQMTPGAARVADPVLTEFAIGYTQAGIVYPVLFPRIQVGTRAGKIVVFGKQAFKRTRQPRAPGAGVRRIPISYGSQNYSIQDDALDAQVPRELVEEASAGPGINLAMGAVSVVRGVQENGLEYAAAQLARNPANYASGNKLALSGSSQWSDPSSDPVQAVTDAREAVRQKIGRRPNVGVFPAAAVAKLSNHPKIVERYKYTGRDSITAEMLAALFGLEKLAVGDAIDADDSDATSDIWGKDVVLAYTDPAPVRTLGTPTYGMTYALSGYPVVEPERWDGDTRSWLYGTTEAASPVITAPDAAFLFQNAVA